jgi:hypothetical protein
MKVYNPGTLIILEDSNISYKGIILENKIDDVWLGGGFYEIYWNPRFFKNNRLSFSIILDYEKEKVLQVFEQK